jgi:ferritin heavy chain
MILDELNTQMNNERMNAAQYDSLSAALENSAWSGFAKWMREAANDERMHYQKFEAYLIARGYAPQHTALPVPMNMDGDQPLPLFQAAYSLEQNNTVLINKLAEMAEVEDDEQTESWIIWAIEEQTRSIKDLYDRVLEMSRQDSAGLLMLDREYGGD